MEIPLEECSGVSKCGKPVLQRCLPGCRWWKAAHSRVQKWLLLECGLTPFSHNIKGKSRHSVQHAQHLICTSPLNCCSPNDSPLEHEKKNVEFIEGNANRRQEHSQQESARQWEYTTFFFSCSSGEGNAGREDMPQLCLYHRRAVLLWRAQLLEK